MTKPTQDKETLREAVARIAEQICGCATPEQRKRDIALIETEIDRRVNAAIATTFEHLRTPLTEALEAAYISGSLDAFGEGSSNFAKRAADDLLTAFQQENSDA